MVGPHTPATSGQMVVCLGHWVVRIGQMVASAGPLGHWVGLVAIGQVVGWVAHWVTSPAPDAAHSVITPAHSVVTGLHWVRMIGHTVGRGSAGHSVSAFGQLVGSIGHWVVVGGHSV